PFVATSFYQDDHVLMNHSLPFRARRRWAACLILLTSAVVFSDEWKARHPLIPPAGVMNLPEPPSPAEVFFSGPQSPADSAAWLESLKAWRRGELIRFRLPNTTGQSWPGPSMFSPKSSWSFGIAPFTTRKRASTRWTVFWTTRNELVQSMPS